MFKVKNALAPENGKKLLWNQTEVNIILKTKVILDDLLIKTIYHGSGSISY